MKFLLVGINAKYIHSNPALYSLKAYAGEQYRENIEIAEYTINNYEDEILRDIYLKKPDFIGFSCYIWNITVVLNLAAEIKKVLPEVPLWLGGPEVSYDAPGVLSANPCLTGIMVGEGEETFRELLQYYLERESRNPEPECQKAEPGLENIAGLVLPSGRTAERELTDLSGLPFLYRNTEQFENRIIYYESSRGCPFRCSYCLSSIDKKLRLRDTETVLKELEYFLEKKVPQVKFVDRTFNCNHCHAKAIWKYLLEHDNGITNFHFELAGDLLDEEEIRILNAMRPGLVQLEIGVQSTNPETLREIDRVTDMVKLKENVEKIHRTGNIHIHLDLIAGLPYENYESFKKSFNDVYAMEPNQLQLGFLKVLKGSKMHRNAEKYGICYRSTPPYEVMYSDWITFDEIIKLKRVEEVLELYYNSSQYTHTLPFLERAFSSPFEMYEKLADFYREKGYDLVSSSRHYRYRILLDFAIRYDRVNEEIYRELLTLDGYLRENLKSRPDYSRSLEPFRKAAADFYRKEKETGKYLPEYSEYDAKQIRRMTHLEPFFYPVYDPEKIKTVKREDRTEQPVYLLFDYKKRNPLTNEAEIREVEIGSEKL